MRNKLSSLVIQLVQLDAMTVMTAVTDIAYLKTPSL